MADRYWVGGTGSWTAVSTTNWSATSGGAAGASAPTAADNVFFNAASSGASYTVTITQATSALNVNIAAPATGVVTIAGTVQLSINGSIDVVASTVWTHTGTLLFVGATTPVTCAIRPTITSAISTGTAKTLNLTNDLTTTTTCTLGTLNFNLVLNGFNLNCSQFNWSNGNLNVGATNVTATTGNLVISAPATSTFTATTGWLQLLDASGVASSGVGVALQTSGTSTMALRIRVPNNSSNNAQIELNLAGSQTISTLQVESPTTTGQKRIGIRQNNKVINNLNLGTVGADPSRRIFVGTVVALTPFTITNATSATLVNVDFRGVGLSVARSGTSLGSCGATANITFTAAKTVYWNLAAGGSWAQNAFATTSGGAVALANWPLPQDTVIFDNAGLNTGATITNNGVFVAMPGMNASTRSNAMTLTVGGISQQILMSGTVYNFSSAFTLTATANTLEYSTTVSNFTYLNSTTPHTLLLQGLGSNITLGANSFGTSISLLNGTFNLNNFTLTLNGSLNYVNTVTTKTLAFANTGAINLTALSGTLVSGASTNFSVTGTGTRNLNVTAAPTTGTRTLTMSGLTAANYFSINVSAGSGAALLAFTSNSVWLNINFTGYTGGFAAQYIFTTIGNVTFDPALNVTNLQTFSFEATSGTQTFTPNGRAINNATKNGAGTLSFAGASTMGSFTINAGTVNLNNFTYTIGNGWSFGNVSVVTTVTLDWGAVGSTINMTGASADFRNIRSTQTLVTWTGAGTKTINYTSATNSGIRQCSPGTNLTEALAPIINITGAPAAGTASFTFGGTLLTSLFKSITFPAGGNYTWNNVTSGNIWMYGNLTLTSTVVINYTGGIFFRNTSGTAIFTSAGRTIPGNLGQNGVGGTVQQADAAICSNAATGFTMSGGTWNLNNFTLTTTKFASTITAARTLAFGTGSMTLTSTATGSVFTIDNGTGFLVTGTPTVNVTSATASISKLITCKSMAENGTLNFNVTGPSTQTVDFSQGAATPAGVRAINLTGFLGSVTSSGGNDINIYGSLTVDAATTWSAITSTLVFSNTSGTAILNTAGKTMGPITMAGAGGTLQFGAAVTYSVGGTGILTLTAGTINFNGFTGTFKSFSSSNSNVRTLNIASTTFLFTSPNAAIWDVATSTNFTLTATSGVINMQAPAGTYTFNGGGLSYPTVIFVNAGVNPTFIVTGNNTFATFGSASGTRTLSLAAGSTQTITGAFNYAGLAGSPNQVATLNSTVAGTQATISKASGTVIANLLSIQDSNATGGATWDAYTNGNNINGGNNSGWLFAAAAFLANAFFNFF